MKQHLFHVITYGSLAPVTQIVFRTVLFRKLYRFMLFNLLASFDSSNKNIELQRIENYFHCYCPMKFLSYNEGFGLPFQNVIRYGNLMNLQRRLSYILLHLVYESCYTLLY